MTELLALGACLALTAASPLWAALLLPLLLGGPHLAAGAAAVDAVDGRRTLLRTVAPLLAVVSLVGVWSLSHGSADAVRLAHLAGAAAVALAARGGRPAAAAAALAILGLAFPGGFSLALAHGHNGVALAAWGWSASRRGAKRPWLAPGLAAVCAAAILLGALDGVAGSWRATSAAGLSWLDLERVLAPGLSGAWPGRVVLSFIFLQSAHYAAWIWGVPRELGGGRWRGFMESAAARSGRPAAWAAVAVMALVPLAAFAGPVEIRAAYLGLAAYHGWLELAGAARLSRA